MFENTESHESYGMISFCKFTSNKTEFFGTDVSQNGGIQIEISDGEVDRHLNRETYFAKKQKIKVMMSYNQFYEAIGAMMNTSGVPCTYVWKDGKHIEAKIQDKTQQELFQDEFQEDVNRIGNELDETVKKLEKALEGKSLKKSEMREILQSLKHSRQDIKSNLPFVLSQFGKTLNKSMREAKNSFAGFIESKIFALGLTEAKKDVKKMLDIDVTGGYDETKRID